MISGICSCAFTSITSTAFLEITVASHSLLLSLLYVRQLCSCGCTELALRTVPGLHHIPGRDPTCMFWLRFSPFVWSGWVPVKRGLRKVFSLLYRLILQSFQWKLFLVILVRPVYWRCQVTFDYVTSVCNYGAFWCQKQLSLRLKHLWFSICHLRGLCPAKHRVRHRPKRGLNQRRYQGRHQKITYARMLIQFTNASCMFYI